MKEYDSAERAVAELLARKLWGKPLTYVGSVTRNELLELARKSKQIIEQSNREKQTSK